MICHTDNGHFGDCFWVVLAMSKVPGSHTLHCNPVYHDELRGLVEGLPIAIEDCSNIPRDSYNCWIASGQFPRIHYADDIDIMGFVMRYFNAMTTDTGHGPVFKSREDLWCNFPSISEPIGSLDVLVLNADPKSGQCPRYSSSEMDALIARLIDRGHFVGTVQGKGLSMVDIGRASIGAKLILGCATGPMWPTFNVWNKSAQRIVLLDPMRLDYGPSNHIEHCGSESGASAILERMGWL